MRHKIFPRRILGFLITLLFFLVVYPYLHQLHPKHILMTEGFFALLMAGGLLLFLQNKKLFSVFAMLAILILLGNWIANFTHQLLVIQAVLLIEFVFFSGILGAMVRFMFSQQKITLDKLLSAICAYLVLGMLFALIYTFIAVTFADAFFYTLPTAEPLGAAFPHPAFFAEALYFSYVTLSTLGYGDWVPTLGPLKMIAALEAIMGQLFLAILIARLVGVHLLQNATKAKT